jgi:broad-specificity NMP kinase
MLVFCPQCGEYGLDRRIDPNGPVAICKNCEHALSIQYLPLFIVGGASGVGKSTVCRELADEIDSVVCMDVDMLWDRAFSTIESSFEYNTYYLRQAVTVAQSGRPVVLFGADIGQPGIVEETVEQRYFSSIHYLALTCESEVQAERLRKRSNWSDATDHWTMANEQVALNRWYDERGDAPNSPIETLDATDRTVEQMATRVAEWIDQQLEATL